MEEDEKIMKTGREKKRDGIPGGCLPFVVSSGAQKEGNAYSLPFRYALGLTP